VVGGGIESVTEQTVAALGEDAVVGELLALCRPTLGPETIVGGGDDCAVVASASPDTWLLLKADSVIEGVHFLPETEPERVGWKALARVSSDMAAMGGTGLHALVSLAVPPNRSMDWLRGIYRGLASAAEALNISLVGGDTSHTTGPAWLSVALHGRVSADTCVLRSGGTPGDLLYVTGTLGGSFATGRHLDFTPRISEGTWLAAHKYPTAMMDLSDGLASDLPRLAKASRCGWRLDPHLIPCTEGCTVTQAMTDGEDFELLFAVSASTAESLEIAWSHVFPGTRLTRIGALTVPGDLGDPTFSTLHGYDHFQHP
jgi:thiamine-monophosphate kinase